MKLLINGYHRDSIDPSSLVEGDRVEVRYCDTGASCVWSYEAIAVKRGTGLALEPKDSSLTNQAGDNALLPNGIDNCYVYLTKPIRG